MFECYGEKTKTNNTANNTKAKSIKGLKGKKLTMLV